MASSLLRQEVELVENDGDAANGGMGWADREQVNMRLKDAKQKAPP